MFLNELPPGSNVELTALIGSQKLVFQENCISLSLDDKRLAKELNKITKGYSYAVVPAIRQDDKIVGFPTSGVVYQLIGVNEADKKVYLWPNVMVKQIRLPDQPPMHFFLSKTNAREYNRRARYRLWMGVSGIVTIGLERRTFDVTIKDVSSTGVAFIIQNKLLEENNLTLNPQSLVVLTFFDEASGSNFRLSALVVRQNPADEMRTIFGCKFSEENHLLAQFITKRQREKLREQRK